jgi:large subunit ribosomal protein L1
MKKHSKRYTAIKEKIDPNKEYALTEAVALLKEYKPTKFDETVDVVMRLGVDPKQSDQQVRGAIMMPHGLGKTVRILAFAKGDAERQAKEAGADYVGAEDMAQKINEGWLEFDAVVATPDMMSVVGRLGKILGTRGLMPNPKTGTVTPDIGKAVKELKMGKSQYRLDKAGIIHSAVGKLSFTKQQLEENIHTLIEAVVRAKPAGAKGVYVKKIVLSTTMGPGVRLIRSDMGA